MTDKIDFIDLKTQYGALKPRIAERMQAVLDHGQYIMGPEVQELEARLAAYTGARHCITVSSGTEALLIAMMALGLKAGDEVITTPFTFAATGEMIVLLGARPVFVDIEPGTCNIDARRIWINLELAKKPAHCLEYIVVHELVHLLERNHTERFMKAMDKHLPQWRLCRDELNSFILGHCEWDD